MDERKLLAWAAGALTVALLLVTFVALARRGGALTSTLGGIGTAVGLAIGALLSALSWGGASWALRAGMDPRQVVARAGAAGLAAGALFALVFVVAGSIASRQFGVLLTIVFFGAFAGLAGAIVGFLLATLGLALWWVAQRAAAWASRPGR